MSNIIINNPTEKQLEEARLIQRLHTDPMLSEQVNTSVAAKVAKRRISMANWLRPKDLCKMKFIPWETVAMTLSRLNKTIRYTNLPDAKVGIGFLAPSKKEVSDWERAALSPAEREEVMRLGNHQGPRPFLVAASRGWVSPYTRILTDSFPTQVVCRSLKSICTVLIAHGGFSWDEAEREFGFRMRGPGTEEKTERIHATPQDWAANRPHTQVD